MGPIGIPRFISPADLAAALDEGLDAAARGEPHLLDIVVEAG